MKVKKLLRIGNPSCIDCKALTKMLKNENVSYIHINNIENPEIAREFGVKSIPTLLLLEDWEEILRMEKINYAKFKEIIERFKK